MHLLIKMRKLWLKLCFCICIIKKEGKLNDITNILLFFLESFLYLAIWMLEHWELLKEQMTKNHGRLFILMMRLLASIIKHLKQMMALQGYFDTRLISIIYHFLSFDHLVLCVLFPRIIYFNQRIRLNTNIFNFLFLVEVFFHDLQIQILIFQSSFL